MSTNSRQIEEILDRRLGRNAYTGKGRLQKVEERIKTLQGVKEKVSALYALVSKIDGELENQEGSYYKILLSDPEAKAQFDEVRRINAQEKLDVALSELEKLEKRFSRNALRIAFIGRERQGKSTFLKTITGLNDKVIPAYSGNSCTGAVSVIHNSSAPLRVDVEYFSIDEFLNTVREKLKRFFPGKRYNVGRLTDVKNLNLPQYLPKESNATTTLVAEYNKFKDAYINHFDEYYNLVGSGVVSYYDEDEIARHVAQYEEFDTPVDDSIKVEKDDGTIVYQLNYYKYVAVKGVDIYTPFKIAETQKLELVDTIGIGSAADSKAIEDEMFRVLRDDCDAAVDLFRPEKTANYPIEQSQLLDDLRVKLGDRAPSKFIVYVINKATSGQMKNVASVNGVLPQIESNLAGMPGEAPVAWVRDVDGESLNEVSERLINPLLDLISTNLDELDSNLMKQASGKANDAYNECLSLVKAASSVISSSAENSEDIDDLYNKLLDDFSEGMNHIDEEGYAQKKDQPCEEIENAYKDIINHLSDYLPKQEDILRHYQTGAKLTEEGEYLQYVEQMHNDIFAAFENVNVTVLLPLQEKVKDDIVGILYENALLKRLPVNFDGEKPNTLWLKEILDNYVDEKRYPYLYKALRFILDYQVNIEGLVEYNVTKSLYIIDRTREGQEFMSYRGGNAQTFEGMASNVWQELANCIWPLTQRLSSWIGEFALIPSQSFYSRVDKFHRRMTTDKGGQRDFRRFIMSNKGLIWHDEISNMAQSARAFGDWNDRVKDLREVVKSGNFTLK